MLLGPYFQGSGGQARFTLWLDFHFLRITDFPGVEQLREHWGGSGPEPILPLLISLIFSELRRLSVPQSPDVYFRKGGGNPVSLRINSGQDHDEIAVGNNIVHIDAECATGQFHRALKKASDLVMALVIA
jgi:hypothetical protein